jgi:CRISPR-associated protein Csm2
MSHYPSPNKGRQHSSDRPFHQGGQKERKQTFDELGKEVIKTDFMEKGITVDELLNIHNSSKLNEIFNALEQFVSNLANGLTPSQLRNVYGRIIKSRDLTELKLVRPNLVYVAARNNSKEGRKFMAFVDQLIQKVDNDNKRKALNKVLEAIVAYHKYAKN